MVAHANPVRLDDEAEKWLKKHKADLEQIANRELPPLRSVKDFLRLCAQTTGQDAHYVCRVLRQLRLSGRDIALTLNYPAYTTQQLARHFDMPVTTVKDRISRVRRILPAMARWSAVGSNPHEFPALQNMDRIEFHDSDRLDEDKIRQSF